jgi:ComF family protein
LGNPCYCILCLGRDPTGLNLCSDCRGDLPWLLSACPRCALPVPVAGQICGACQRRPRAFDACTALFGYAAPVDRLVQQLKFRANLHLARLFANLMTERLSAAAKPDCIIPVPLHRARQRDRGFNQAVEIARPLAAQLGCRLDVETCIRIRPTPPQSQLNAGQRRRNLRGAFALQQPLRGRHLALVDDVMTTGSTLNALANLLRRAGAERIEVWLCARTQLER